jgi:hypothetical protein
MAMVVHEMWDAYGGEGQGSGRGSAIFLTPVDLAAPLRLWRRGRPIALHRRLAPLGQWTGQLLSFHHARVIQPPLRDVAAPRASDERRSDCTEDNRSLHAIGGLITSVSQGNMVNPFFLSNLQFCFQISS